MAESSLSSAPPLDLRDLKAVSVLGRGAKGVVFLVRADTSAEALALKAISRDSIEHKGGGAVTVAGGDAYRRIWIERDVLLALHHPLLPSLRGFVSTDKIVGFAIDRCSGGDLNSLRRRQSEKMFSDDVIRFYASELVLALEYLHGLGIVYRDLKPENVLIQQNGHLMLVDFDLSTRLSPRSPESLKTPSKEIRNPRPPPAKKKFLLPGCFSCNAGVSPDNFSDTPEETAPRVPDADGGDSPVAGVSGSLEKSNSFVGTEEYVAPEVIRGDGHDFAVDWWSLGVLLYEMLYGRTPFRGQNRKETFYRILTKDPELVGEPTPLRDLILKLLQKDPENRISLEGIKRHEFFHGVDWDAVTEISRPPFIPSAGADWEEEEGRIPGNGETIDVEKLVQEVFASANGNKGVDERVTQPPIPQATGFDEF